MQSSVNVVKVYCEHGAIVPRVRELQRHGLIELVYFPYDPGSRTKRMSPTATPSAAQWEDANITWDEAKELNFDDFVGSDKLPEIMSIVGSSNRRDALHVDSAYKSLCKCFLTVDSDILCHRDRLFDLLGIYFFSPDRDWDAFDELIGKMSGDAGDI